MPTHAPDGRAAITAADLDAVRLLSADVASLLDRVDTAARTIARPERPARPRLSSRLASCLALFTVAGTR